MISNSTLTQNAVGFVAVAVSLLTACGNNIVNFTDIESQGSGVLSTEGTSVLTCGSISIASNDLATCNNYCAVEKIVRGENVVVVTDNNYDYEQYCEL